MNKKGEFGALLFFFILVCVLLVLGLFLAIGGSAIDLFVDEYVPAVKDIGTVGAANITQYSGYVLNPLDTFVQSWSWLLGVGYLIGIIGLFGMAMGYRATMSRVFLAIFVALTILILLLSIFISNIYQDLYEDTDELGDRIKEYKLLSFLMINAPAIFCFVIFAAGIVMFTGVGGQDTI